ncbi:unnamed protein product [Mytilus coruscus]|uniref:Reverse transcriptase domain-containing protein n=1 Tax=Mytilus coruscus TaxID=42192 RepID=A0A6J8B871_MYTCO|nr:unnamed protein product [Mytilus coruscus]
MAGSNGINESTDIKAVRHKTAKFHKRRQNKHDKQSDIKKFPKKANNCDYCGRQCEKEKCPAYGKKCDSCGRYNHFKSQCRQGKYMKRRSEVKHVSVNVYTDDSESEFEINTVESSEINMVQSKIFAKMLLVDQNKQIKFQLDSGATANLIPKSLVHESLIEETDNTLTMYNKSQMSAYGICTLRLKNPKTNKRYNVKFIVVGDEYTPLLGSRAIQQMSLIKIQFHNILTCEKGDNMNDFSMQNIVKEYADIFDGEGSFQGHLHLEIDETITPVKSPLRRIPIAMKPKLKSKLQRLETNGVIKAVDTPTDWVSSLVTVKKPNGKLRICIDPKILNKALKRSHYPLPIIDDLLPELNEAKIFSKCDVKNGFWHVNMDESSSYLTTFETPFGRFRLMKMPFGISPAPEYFQQFLEREIENLPGVRTVADDILIYGEGDTVEEATADHDIKLKAFLDRCRSRNIKLNRDKFQLRLTEMPYIGHLLTADGVKPGPEKNRCNNANG